MTTIGYARVSTDGQTLQAQTEALHAAGCARIFAEKISGAHADRPQLAKAIAVLHWAKVTRWWSASSTGWRAALAIS